MSTRNTGYKSFVDHKHFVLWNKCHFRRHTKV